MGTRTLILRRPVRAAAMTAGLVALVGCGAALVPGVTPPRVLAFALGYGAFLGWLVVGLILASGFPATRRWWIGSAVPLVSMAFVALGAALWPAALLRWWSVIGGASLVIIASWLSAGCLLALLGWWSHARRGRRDAA